MNSRSRDFITFLMTPLTTQQYPFPSTKFEDLHYELKACPSSAQPLNKEGSPNSVQARAFS